jgi:hypothetical protein
MLPHETRRMEPNLHPTTSRISEIQYGGPVYRLVRPQLSRSPQFDI